VYQMWLLANERGEGSRQELVVDVVALAVEDFTADVW
jgi:hypothetical protein